ncbi:PQQ-binding-like beta-propeller repeat protein [Streptomyces sp. NPDC008001]|uniref:serine/threonine-protein kinase n=1 Tax=Streptomyces sp. NPDC008001 TaxID=3364804 RepID=UPI0036E84A6F
MAVLEPLRDATPPRIGPYELLARLGSGGMGEVHLARGPEGLVAVKTVRAELAGRAGFRARFRREIAVARSVTSPHVARLTGGDADADLPWLATEYAPGPTLAEAVALAGPLPAGTVRALGAHLVRALHAVHAAPALHRDLKPGNVLLAADGPRLIDFGVARAPDATTLTGTGLMVGTPGFMSPEHLKGGRHVVAASDVFCLASVLCYAATGENPFGDGPLVAVLHRVSQAKADLTAVPEPLRGILADCLHPDPAARPDTATLAARLGAPEEGAFDWPPAIRDRIAEDRTRSAALSPATNNHRADTRAPAPARPEEGLAPPGSAAGAERRGGDFELAAPGTAAAGFRRDADQPLAGSPAVPGRHGDGAPAAVNSFRRDDDQPPAGYPAVPNRPGGRPATPGPVVPGGHASPHNVPTIGAPYPPAVQASPSSRPRTAVKLGLAGLAACVVGAAAVFGIYAGTRSDGGGAAGKPEKPEAAAAGKAPAAGQDGVDETGGPDGAGALSGTATARPTGWHDWSGKLSKGPLGCAADKTALVCQLVDGSYEAVGAKDGKQLWRYDPVGDPHQAGTTAMISPTGLIMIPGGGLPPAVRGGTAVVAAGGRIQARDAATGTVRWEKRHPDGNSFKGKPLVVDGRAFVGVSVSGQGYDLYAYDLSDGRELWHKRLANVRLARAFQQDFSPVAAKDGVVYARAERGVSAYDAATGDERGETEPVPRGCAELFVQGVSVLCGEHSDRALKLHQLDARSLAAGADVPLPEGTVRRDPRITAANDKYVVGVDDTASRLLVIDRSGRTPEAVRTLPKSEAPFPRTLASAPLIIGDQVVFATNTALVQAPFGTGTGRATAVEGAPGDRPEPDYNKKNGVDIARSVRPPFALPAGDVVHIVYDQGAIRSVALPH